MVISAENGGFHLVEVHGYPITDDSSLADYALLLLTERRGEVVVP